MDGPGWEGDHGVTAVDHAGDEGTQPQLLQHLPVATALVRAGIPDLRENGCHALRHFFASTALHEGETIKAVSEYLGHADPGFTLRTYTHLMEGSSERTKRAIDAVFGTQSDAEEQVTEDEDGALDDVGTLPDADDERRDFDDDGEDPE